MPSASETMATAVTKGVLKSVRKANLRLRIKKLDEPRYCGVYRLGRNGRQDDGTTWCGQARWLDSSRAILTPYVIRRCGTPTRGFRSHLWSSRRVSAHTRRRPAIRAA